MHLPGFTSGGDKHKECELQTSLMVFAFQVKADNHNGGENPRNAA